MHACRLAVCAASVAWLVGCSQSVSPTAPTSVSADRSVLAAAGNEAGAATPTGVVSKSAAREVPFKGRLEGSFTFVPDPPPSTFASVDFGPLTGNATHLGGFILKGPHRVNLAATPATAIGTFEFTAANGDTLRASFTGLGTPTATPGIASIVETATITGGTGRFAGATGSFIVERIVDLINLQTTGSFEGTIVVT
jgi:hypothetical protein